MSVSVWLFRGNKWLTKAGNLGGDGKYYVWANFMLDLCVRGLLNYVTLLLQLCAFSFASFFSVKSFMCHSPMLSSYLCCLKVCLQEREMEMKKKGKQTCLQWRKTTHAWQDFAKSWYCWKLECMHVGLLYFKTAGRICSHLWTHDAWCIFNMCAPVASRPIGGWQDCRWSKKKRTRPFQAYVIFWEQQTKVVIIVLLPGVESSSEQLWPVADVIWTFKDKEQIATVSLGAMCCFLK